LPKHTEERAENIKKLTKLKIQLHPDKIPIVIGEQDDPLVIINVAERKRLHNAFIAVSNAYEERSDIDQVIELADDIITGGRSLYAMIKAQVWCMGEEITLFHRDHALAEVLKVMSPNNTYDPLIEPEDMKEYRGHMEDRRRSWREELDESREYLPYIKWAYEMIEDSQKTIDLYERDYVEEYARDRVKREGCNEKVEKKRKRKK
jgi:hypothetical protein